MTTWKCSDCGSEYWEEDEYIDICPVCGSSDVYEAHFCADCEKEVCEGELDEDDRCAECSAKADAYDEMVDRVRDALSKPIDMVKIAKQILTKPKPEIHQDTGGVE